MKKTRFAWLIDALLCTVLLTLALSPFGGSFDGQSYLVGAISGTLTGVAVVQLLHWRSWPRWWLLPLLLAGFALVAPAACLYREGLGGPLPTLRALATSADVLWHGWKQLLTTLPPVEGDGRLTLIPFTLGLLGGCAAMMAARFGRHPGLSCGVAVTVAAVATLLGVQDPPAIMPRAIAFFAVALVWSAVQRDRALQQTSGGGWVRVLSGALMVALTVAVAVPLYLLDRPDTAQRTVLRSYVAAPIDLLERPSPLAGFRQLRPGAGTLGDKVLLTVEGLPAGVPVRLATLDAYSGRVWTASGTDTVASTAEFWRVGAHIPVNVTGQRLSYKVTMAEDYASNRDLRHWVPLAGATERVDFQGPDRVARSESLRLNPKTGSAIVAKPMTAQDSYQAQSVLTTPVPPQQPARDQRTPLPVDTAVLQRFISEKAPAADPATTLQKVGDYFRTNGALTSGGPGEEAFLPGHSLGRLTELFTYTEPAGDGEQYASAMALVAAHLGYPTRVVLGTFINESGVVRGKDTQAWIEVRNSDGQWAEVRPDAFMPPASRQPKKERVMETNHAPASVVPPPNAARPPGSLDPFVPDDHAKSSALRGAGLDWLHLPLWLRVTFRYAGPPVTIVLALGLTIVLAKLLRTILRQRRGSSRTQVTQGWNEVMDFCADITRAIPRGQTRVECARAYDSAALMELALSADSELFGPTAPTPATAQAFWQAVEHTKADLVSHLPWYHRLRVRLTPLSLLPAWVIPHRFLTNTHSQGVYPTQRHRMRVASSTGRGLA